MTLLWCWWQNSRLMMENRKYSLTWGKLHPTLKPFSHTSIYWVLILMLIKYLLLGVSSLKPCFVLRPVNYSRVVLIPIPVSKIPLKMLVSETASTDSKDCPVTDGRRGWRTTNLRKKALEDAFWKKFPITAEKRERWLTKSLSSLSWVISSLVVERGISKLNLTYGATLLFARSDIHLQNCSPKTFWDSEGTHFT